ncbi:hypothetical protein [Achromobacter sp. UMC71]|uniref:hypothetical protein n=1 Tax=Achromobacter sp. UMC71 TaxID=1862320 RepID=UPI001600EFAF|nr:hypothetical protein [Achromobacter sp. UMC71]
MAATDSFCKLEGQITGLARRRQNRDFVLGVIFLFMLALDAVFALFRGTFSVAGRAQDRGAGPHRRTHLCRLRLGRPGQHQPAQGVQGAAARGRWQGLRPAGVQVLMAMGGGVGPTQASGN